MVQQLQFKHLKNFTIMKKQNFILASIFLCFFFGSYGQNINFPDPNFKTALLNHKKITIDKNNDGEISVYEAELMTGIGVSDANISSLEGIQYFKNITSLGVVRNNLTSLDLSKNTNLIYLFVYNNNLTSLNVNGCTKITRLWAGNNKLSSLNLSTNKELFELQIHNNQFKNLNVSYNPNLSILYAWQNQFQTIDLKSNINLTRLFLWDNELTTLDVTKNTEIYQLIIGSNKFTRLDISKNINILNLDLKEVPNLEYICIDENYPDVVALAQTQVTKYGYSCTIGTDCNAIPTTTNFNHSFSLTPNPATDYLYLRKRNPRTVISGNIKIYTLSGQLVKTIAPNDPVKPSRSSPSSIDDVEQRIDIRNLQSNQQYIITVPIHTGALSTKFLKL